MLPKITPIHFSWLFLSMFTLLGSCYKNDQLSPTTTLSQQFDVAQSKEWWYGTFRKSAAYSYRDETSVFNPSAEKLKRWPDWSHAISYDQNGLAIAEIPLVYSSKKTVLPDMEQVSFTDQVRLLKAALQKLLIIKRSDGQTIVRTVTLIPTLAYAREKQFDMSGNTLQQIDSRFSGWMIVKNWQEELVQYWGIVQGRVSKRYTGLKRAASQNATILPATQSINVDYLCVIGYEEVEVASFCVAESQPIGDVPPTEEEDCDDWIPVYGTIPIFGDCEVPETEPQDACTLYGVGCPPEEGGEGGYGDPDGGGNIGNTDIINEVTDPCLKAMVDQAMDASCGNAITTAIYTMFGTGTNYDITFGQAAMGNFINVNDGLTTMSYFPAGPNNLASLQAHISLNISPGSLPSASYEYIVATILHEALHAWIQAMAPTNPQSGSNVVSHETMTSPTNISLLAGAIQAMCPNVTPQDAIDLAWGGLQQTTGETGWTQLSQSTRSRIQTTNAEHRNRTRGTTPCAP